MNKNKTLLFALGLMSTSVALSGTMGDSVVDTQPFFLAFGSGASMPFNLNPSVNTTEWSTSTSGYAAGLSTTPLFTAGFGYVFSKLINIDFNYTYRGPYGYSKYQVAEAGSTLGDRMRFLKISSNSLLFDVTLDGAGLSNTLTYATFNKGFIQPFIGAGLGVSYNDVSNFHTTLLTGGTQSTMLHNVTASLAYQFNAGLEWQHQSFAVDLGYRYFNAGNYASNNFIINTAPITPWTGTLSSNEVFVTAKISI